MKTKFTIILVAMILIVGMSAQSQNGNRPYKYNSKQGEKPRIGMGVQARNGERLPEFKEKMIKAKFQEIKKSLRLNEQTLEKFRPVYLQYQRDLIRIDSKMPVRMMKVDADSLNADEASKIIDNQFMVARKRLNVRERYYQELKLILTPQQILKLYQIESEIGAKVMAEGRKRIQEL
jgi:hypothetical protein